MARKVFLDEEPLDDVRRRWLARADIPRRTERIPTAEALNRVAATDLYARVSMPNYNAAAMDGFAVRAERTFFASETNPVRLRVGEEAIVVDTGDPLPEGTDAVIAVERVHLLDDGRTIEVLAPVAPWQDVRPIGEDVVVGEMILPAFRRLRPYDLGALLAGGVLEIEVLARPRVAVLPTGDELVPPKVDIGLGEIPEFNGAMLRGLAESWGAVADVFPITPDEPELLRERVATALERYDVVVLNAGSSAGRDDYTADILGSFGEIVAHGVATRPGKPVVLAVTPEGRPLLGIPGFPVSAFLAMEWFLKPLLDRYYGEGAPPRPRVRALLGRRLVSAVGRDEFVRVTVGKVEGRYVVQPLSRGAGVTMSLVRADGLLVVPRETEGFEQGTEVEVELFRDPSQIDRTVVLAGSHDFALDLLRSHLRRKDPTCDLSSSHVGSTAGLQAIARREAHGAGIHLLDPEDGTYNVSYVRRHIRGVPVVLVHLATRVQGFLVAKGNPLGIRSLEDIARPGVRYVNRQRGAGTRILFDHLLRKAGIPRESVYGYDREVPTHLAVAVAIREGSADVGLGIYAAAKAFELDFVPVGEEQYDLLLLRSFAESPLGACFLEILRSAAFREELRRFGGYDLSRSGEVVYAQDD
ncbi:MAG: molybdopterin biosynthesis protein [Brockia lithotrophica]|nr:molybdopterin biosynthesis protein [Brockia lithotrophica]